MKLSSFAAILYHELAHHLVPEAAPNADKALRERAADAFALRKVLAANYNPILSFLTFAFFAKLEEDLRHTPADTKYETALCRGMKFYAAGLAAGLRDADFIRHFETSGKMQKVSDELVEMKEVIREESCANALDIPASILAARAGRASELHAARMTLSLWKPVPGTCSGVAGELWLDGKYKLDFDNTQQSDELDLGELSIGRHLFALASVSVYCIAPQRPYRLQTIAYALKCDGEFTASRAETLRARMTLPPGGKLYCAID